MTTSDPSMPRAAGTWTAGGVLAGLGLMAVAAQTLLFRSFLSVFEGHELGIALFFGSWLLWVSAGAALARLRLFSAPVIDRGFEFLPLAYVPAFLLQSWLIVSARRLAGVQPYELFPLVKMAAVLVPANAPVSLCTGLLFALACRWMTGRADIPVARVYIWECAGATAGGVACTLLLARGVSEPNVFLLAAAAVSILGAAHAVRRGRAIAALLPLAAIAVAHAAGLAARWERSAEQAAWSRLLPAETLQGAFSTAQARYLYGTYRGQLTVMAWESVAETVYDAGHASEVLALHLAEHPQARRIGVVGTASFSLCRRLLDLPQADTVTWLSPDPQYPGRLLRVLPAELRGPAGRLRIPTVDPRRYLAAGNSEVFDILIVNAGGAGTLAMNRYATREFFALARRRLAPGGLLGVRVPGGENVMGDERANTGASVYQTLKSVFASVVVKPGEETWLLASDAPGLTTAPATLRDRFAAIPGAAALYPPAALLSLFPPDRVAFQTASYERAAAEAGDRLANTDRHPQALFHSLLLAAREAGAPPVATARARAFAASGAAVAPIALALYVALRALYRLRGRERNGPPRVPAVRILAPDPRDLASRVHEVGGKGTPFPPTSCSCRVKRQGARSKTRTAASTAAGASPSRLDVGFLVLAAGLAGMGASIVLMFRYQSVLGSLFLYAGLVSALFMLGLTVGGLAAERRVRGRGPVAARRLITATLVGHAALLAVIHAYPESAARAGAAVLPTLSWPPATVAAGFGALFAAAGLFGGMYVPAAAALLRWTGLHDLAAGSRVEAWDHAGGALGSACIGLVFLPVFGAGYTLALLAGLLLTAGVPLWVPGATPGDAAAGRDAHDRLRPFGFVLAGVCLLLLAAAWRLRGSDAAATAARFADTARVMAQPGTAAARSARLADGTTVDYAAVLAPSGGATNGYVFNSAQLAPAVNGYGGPMSAAVHVDADGRLAGVRLLLSAETPAYLESLAPWLRGLSGRDLFTGDALAGVDAVTGATLSSEALLRLLRESGRAFAGGVLGRDVSAAGPAAAQHAAAAAWPDRGTAVLAALLAAALVVRRRPSRRARLALLAVSAVLLGAILNAQYSLTHVLAVGALRLPSPAARTGFVLAAAVPALVLLLGNVYCGYLCPFGALQELAGAWRVARALRADPPARAWRVIRRVKVALLAAVVLLFAWTGRQEAAGADVLTTVFARDRAQAVALLAAGAVILSLFFGRFWCRNLCPAGAFLSLLNGAHLLRRWIPAVRPTHCPYGVTDRRQLDCLCCDRCREAGAERATAPGAGGVTGAGLSARQRAAALAVAVGCGAAVFLARTVEAVRRGEASGIGTRGAAVMRNVDMDHLRALIERGALSDREALHYTPLPDPGPALSPQVISDQ